MTTLKQITSVDTFGSRNYFCLAMCIFIISVLSAYSTNAQNHFDHGQKYQIFIDTWMVPDIVAAFQYHKLVTNTETAELYSPIVITDNGGEEQRVEVDLAIDQERNDGVDMFMSGYATRGSSKIVVEIDFAQSGHTLVQVFNMVSDELLFTVYEGETHTGKEVYEIDPTNFHIESILVVATHTSKDRQVVKAYLQFNIPVNKEVPSGNGESIGKDLPARMTPTFGRGDFQIHADFKSAVYTTVMVYAANGRLVDTLFSGYCLDGNLTVNGDSSDYPGGTYIVVVQSGHKIWAGKMIVP